MTRSLAPRGLATVVVALVASSVLACGPLHRALDRSALADKADVIARVGSPVGHAPLPFTSEAELEALTRPMTMPPVRRRALTHHRLDRRPLAQEEVSFASPVRLEHAISNRAQAWLYRRGALGERPVVLWVPGLYVSEAALAPLSWFFSRILDTGADVLFYVPPYHLTRTPEGMSSGDAVLATDFADHLAVSAQGIADLRVLLVWLKAQGVETVGGFGGSMGASWLLRISSWSEDLDFLTVMIPLIRWDDVILRPEEMAPVRSHLVQAGWTPERLRAQYAALDPVGYRPRISRDRISVLYAEHDQVTHSVPLNDWIAAWRINRVHAYDRGHATILFTPALYDDYAALLAEDLRSVDAI